MKHTDEFIISLLMLWYFCASAGLIYVGLPWLVLGRDDESTGGERVLRGMVCGTGYWIALTLLLAPFRFNDTFGLAVGTFLLWSGYLMLVRKVKLRYLWEEMYHRNVATFYDLLDETQWLSSRLGGVFRYASSGYYRASLKSINLPILLIWGVFLYSAYLRVYDPLVHLTFSFSDPFVHLVWLKKFNNGDVFADGVYPRGFHAFLSVIGTFSGLEPAYEIRFCGCVVGSLIPPALYFLLRECRISWSASLFGVSWMAVALGFGYKDLAERQTASLPEEFALLFAVLGIAFAVRYLRTTFVRDLVAFALGSFVVFATHSLVAVALGCAGIAILLDSWFRLKHHRREIGRLAALFFASAVIGNLFIVLGILTGHELHAATVNVLSLSLGPSGPQFTAPEIMMMELGPVMIGCLGFSVFLTLFGICRRREAFPSQAFLALWLITIFGLWYAKEVGQFHLPLFADRLVMFMAYPACGVLAWMFALLIEPLLGKWAQKPNFRTLVTLIAILVVAHYFPLDPPEPQHREYDEAARAYYFLAEQLPIESWTIVGQNEEYQLVYTRGFHMQVDQFIHLYNPAGNVKWPTPYTIIVLEKKPMKLLASAELDQRNYQESMLKDWIRVYSYTHGDLHVWDENENVAVYIHLPDEIKHPNNPPNAANLATPSSGGRSRFIVIDRGLGHIDSTLKQGMVNSPVTHTPGASHGSASATPGPKPP